MEVTYIEIVQPIGSFYMCSIKAPQLLRMVDSNRRSKNANGVQRDLSSKRTKEIAFYCSDPDAVFPTPIVVSVYPDKNIKIDREQSKLIFPNDTIIGDVIDGQHRLWGISNSAEAGLFDLPVVFMFGLNTEEKAYIFATINSNQTKVNPSLIYDLFDVSSTRSPKKTAHEIARAFNSDSNSPFFNRLKMLGKKEKSQEAATLSQGTFCKSVVQLISINPDKDALDLKNQRPLKDDPKLPLRKFFIEDNEEVIVKILYNCFSALRDSFPDEWINPKGNILWKTTGFNGIMISLPEIIKKGYKESDLSVEFFRKCFFLFRRYIEENKIKLNKEFFGGGGQQVQRKFAKLLLTSISNINPGKETYVTDVKIFIDNIPEPSAYEMFDIVYVLRHGSVPYGTINLREKADEIIIEHPMVDSFLIVKAKDREKVANDIEARYMDGLDADSWLGFKEAMDKA